MNDDARLPDVLKLSPVRVLAGGGRLADLGHCAQAEGATRLLLVTDPGIERAGHAARALESLHGAGINVCVFDGVEENPSTRHVAAGVEAAQAFGADFFVSLGGGSAMDCAKGVNLIASNGGAVRDYWGEDKATEPMRPLIAIPTTAGTGSEAQSFALISDPTTHQKMACGDRRLPIEGGLRPRVAILDHELTATVPRDVASATAVDAIAHVVETSATTRRTERSLAFSVEAWRFIEPAFERALSDPTSDADREAMLLGAHLAGAAIEESMLGAAHACANPLTAQFNVVHGFAVGVMLPHVIRFNGQRDNPYSALHFSASALADRIAHLLAAAAAPLSLAALEIPRDALPALAESAAQQWTAGFNPRPVAKAELLEIYQAAYD